MGGNSSKETRANPQHFGAAASAPITAARQRHVSAIHENALYLKKTTSNQFQAIPLPEAYIDYLAYAPFVGTIYDSQRNPLGMACLLKNGDICTAMHVVCDAEALEQGYSFEECYYPLSSLSILFTKNGKPPICCKITDLVEDGSSFYGNELGNYDIAILKLQSPPNRLLSEGVADAFTGFVLDDFNHSGAPFMSDPQATVAISGPILKKNSSGENISFRYFSESRNLAGNSTEYVFSVVSSHPSTFGFSGMAMIGSVENNIVLYGINSHRDKIGDYQVGVKISEYLNNRRIYRDKYAHYFQIHREHVLLFSEYHALKRINNDKQAIRAFLNQLKIKSKSPKANVSIDIIPEQFLPIDSSIEFSDRHQYQHICKSKWPNKSYFLPFIGNNFKHKVLNTLQDSVNTMAYLYCEENGITLESIKDKNPIINLGFTVGLSPDGKKKLSHVRIEGFPGKMFHIFPVDPDDKNELKNAFLIDADDFLPKDVGGIKYISPAKSNTKKNVMK